MQDSPDTAAVTFFMLGCPRCGTTWVDAALRGHPDIFLPPQKQTYFFDVYYERGIDWYMENYRETAGQAAVGEIATGYALPHALPKVAECFPHAKVMLAMRDPSQRAYSFYQSRAVSKGWRNIREAVAAEPLILEHGKYIEHIERILEHFPRERVLLLFYDDLTKDDRAYLRTILEFLEVDPDFRSSQIGRMVQVAAFPRLRRFLRRMKLGPLLDLVSRSALGDWLRKLLKQANVRRYPDMDESTRAYLHDFYRPYNERLAAFCGRDLTHWNG